MGVRPFLGGFTLNKKKIFGTGLAGGELSGEGTDRADQVIHDKILAKLLPTTPWSTDLPLELMIQKLDGSALRGG